MSQTPSLFLSLGKEVKDEYGRPVGKIASFAVTTNGRFETVFVEQSDGKFLRQPVEHLKLDGDEITLISQTKSQATVFCDQIPLIWRKDQALKDLNEKKKISSELYHDLHTSFDGALTQLKGEAQVLLDNIGQDIDRLKEEVKTLNYALVHLEIEHEIGKVDEKNYEMAFTIIQDNIKRVNVEKADLEVTLSKLSNILLGDPCETDDEPKTETPAPVSENADATELPEPPVVVYVKELGKSGI
jgi:hypothetical protein